MMKVTLIYSRAKTVINPAINRQEIKFTGSNAESKAMVWIYQQQPVKIDVVRFEMGE